MNRVHSGVRSALLMAAVLAAGRMAAQCPNDNTLMPGATVNPGCPASMTIPCVNAGRYALVAVTAGNFYIFNTCGATYDTRITLYNDAGGPSLGYNDDYCGLQSQVTWQATFTGNLRVLIDRYVGFFTPCGNSGGCAPLSITCILGPPPVTNGHCGVATVLPVLSSCFMQTFQNTGASNSGPNPGPTCGNFGMQRDVWFRFVAPASGRVVIDTEALSLTDGVIQLYTGACGAFVLVQCDNDAGPGLMPRIDRRCNPLVPFQTYFIRFWGYNGQQGAFRICVQGWDYFPTPQEDCVGGATICGSGLITNQTNYTGCTADLNASNRGCLLGNERQGTWYFFSPNANGTVGFVLTPTNANGTPANVDYDFAIWGPMSSITCPPPGPPIRCTYAYPPSAGTYLTGMSPGNSDVSEPASGAGVNGFIAPLPVLNGMIYAMYIDNFDITGQAFNLVWSLSQPDLLDCTVLPVDLVMLRAAVTGHRVRVEWTTRSETNSSHFVVERSRDGSTFLPIGQVPASGHSSSTVEYALTDGSPLVGVSYYRLRMVDVFGNATPSDPLPVQFDRAGSLLTAYPNPAQDLLNVVLPTAALGPLELRLADATGRTLALRRVPADANGPYPLPLADLEAGSYMLELISGGTVLSSTRFVKN